MTTNEIISNMYCLLTWCVLLSIAVCYLIYVLHGKNKDLEAFEREFNLYKSDIKSIKSDLSMNTQNVRNQIEIINSIKSKYDTLNSLKELAEIVQRSKEKETAEMQKKYMSNYLKMAGNLIDLINDYKKKKKKFKEGGFIIDSK